MGSTGNTDEASLACPPLTSCCVTHFLTVGPGVGDSWDNTHIPDAPLNFLDPYSREEKLLVCTPTRPAGENLVALNHGQIVSIFGSTSKEVGKDNLNEVHIFSKIWGTHSVFSLLAEVQGTAKYFFTLKRRCWLVPNYWIPRNFTEAVGPSSLSLFNNVCVSHQEWPYHTFHVLSALLLI